MAEATEQPTGGEATSTPAGGAGAWPAEGAGVAPMSGAAPEVYRPLSLLAVAGFVLAALYAVVVVVGGVMALIARTPWLLPAWTFLVPCAAALVSWMAQARIRASEGTQGGQGLAAWGVGLSLSVGVLYAAYFASTYFAVRQQATDFAQQWLTLVEEGKTEQAFRLTLPPATRPTNNDKLRDNLEMRFNQPGSGSSGSGGMFTRFSRMELVRELAMAGPGRTEVRPLGVSSWGYEQGGYKVQLKYRVTTPLVAFDLQMTLIGTESQAKDSKGRQWQVLAQATNILPDPQPEATELGQEHQQATQDAAGVVQLWMQQVATGDRKASYLLTLPPKKRGPQAEAGQKYDRLVLAAGPLPPAGVGPVAQAWMEGLRAYTEGGLVHADPQTFWALKVKKEPPAEDLDYGPEIIAGVRNLFRRGPGLTAMMTLERSRPQLITRAGRRQIHFDVSLLLRDPGQHIPKFVVEAMLVAEATGADPKTIEGWRVIRLDLLRGHTAPKMPAAAQRGGRPARPPGPPGPPGGVGGGRP